MSITIPVGDPRTAWPQRAQDESGGGKGVAGAPDGHPFAALEGRL
jgi:hypothetical protein